MIMQQATVLPLSARNGLHLLRSSTKIPGAVVITMYFEGKCYNYQVNVCHFIVFRC